MDVTSSNQWLSEGRDERSGQALALIQSERRAVLTMATGGCARYAFSSDVRVALDRRGYPLLHYASPNPHHHLIITNTTMDLRMIHHLDHDGNELSLLILTGMLKMVDPADHGSLDRYIRYFEVPIENHRRGSDRLYRFEPDHVCFELFSGERKALDRGSVVVKNPFSARDEERLIKIAGSLFQADGWVAAGVDGSGLDLRRPHQWRRMLFSTPVKTAQEAEPALAECIP